MFLDVSGQLQTMRDLLKLMDQQDLASRHKRDLTSAILRICQMVGKSPENILLDAPALRALLLTIKPTAHGIRQKTLANLRSLIASALVRAGRLDRLPRGLAKRHAVWGELMDGLAPDKALSAGLAGFTNWCASEDIHPNTVTDVTLHAFLGWLETKTLHLKPRALARRIPLLWNRARAVVKQWPRAKLAGLSFKKQSIRLAWSDLPESFRRDFELYRAKRKNPDVFDESDRTPRRALADSTLRLQSEHLRLAASVLSKDTGVQLRSLACVVAPNAFKAVLRHFREESRRKFLEEAKSRGDETAGRDNKYPPNAFVVGLAATLIQVAWYHTAAPEEEVDALKKWANKLTPVPLDLTPKNKMLLRQLESSRVRANLLFLPERLLGDIAENLRANRFHFVDAQVAIAIDILLAVPLRPQNLSALDWQRHLSMIDGTDRLLLHIPAKEMKSQRQELVAEIPEDVSRRLKWYRQYVLPRLGGDPNGCLFIAQGGNRKDQKTLAGQIIASLNAFSMLERSVQKPWN